MARGCGRRGLAGEDWLPGEEGLADEDWVPDDVESWLHDPEDDQDGRYAPASRPWRPCGARSAIDQDTRLTALGARGFPDALLRAWAPR